MHSPVCKRWIGTYYQVNCRLVIGCFGGITTLSKGRNTPGRATRGRKPHTAFHSPLRHNNRRLPQRGPDSVDSRYQLPLQPLQLIFGHHWLRHVGHGFCFRSWGGIDGCVHWFLCLNMTAKSAAACQRHTPQQVSQRLFNYQAQSGWPGVWAHGSKGCGGDRGCG